MPEDSGNFDIAPLLMLAARTQMAQMTKRLAVKGFDGLTPAFANVTPLLDAKGSRATVLAQKAGVTKQAMSQLVKLLEQRDNVEQVPPASRLGSVELPSVSPCPPYRLADRRFKCERPQLHIISTTGRVRPYAESE
jgi:hypothetical protein